MNFDNAMPSWTRRGLGELGFSILWGDLTESDLELLNVGMTTVDSIGFEMQKEKQAEKPGRIKIKSPFDGV